MPSNRKSGLKRKNPDAGKQQEIDTEESFGIYSDFAENYMRLLGTKNKKKAFIVRWEKDKKLFYIAFSVRPKLARSEAYSFFSKTIFDFFDKGRSEYLHLDVHRIPKFDKYQQDGRIPIKELLEYGATFSCSHCGKDRFNYNDFEIGRCFLLDGEGSINPFTKGIILCYNCYRKL